MNNDVEIDEMTAEVESADEDRNTPSAPAATQTAADRELTQRRAHVRTRTLRNRLETF
ncbi:MAG: hypothetical protein AAFV29_26140 [Myxococcota bacterium]